MNILELATRLKAIYDQHGDVDVMFLDHDSNPCGVNHVVLETVEDEDYLEEYNMPQGFKFVSLT
jgi:hypothetical protein